MHYEIRFANSNCGCQKPHTHNYTVVCAVRNGSLGMRFGDQDIALSAEMVCIIPHNLQHNICSFSNDFSGVDVLSIYPPDSEATARLSLKQHHVCIEDARCYQQFQQFCQSKCNSPEALQRLEDLCTDLHHECSDSTTETSQRVRNQTAAKIKSLLDSEYMETDILTRVAAEFSYSKEHCNRLFRNAYDISIQSYHLNQKAEHARRLLQSNLPLSDVALEAGFYDQSHMTRTFKNIFQMTPTDYRNSQRTV